MDDFHVIFRDMLPLQGEDFIRPHAGEQSQSDDQLFANIEDQKNLLNLLFNASADRIHHKGLIDHSINARSGSGRQSGGGFGGFGGGSFGEAALQVLGDTMSPRSAIISSTLCRLRKSASTNGRKSR